MITQGAEAAQNAAFDDVRASTPTVGWFVRRSALWISILTVAVVFACTLYALASQVGADDTRMPQPEQPALKV
ncbi:hypothetical protein [Hyphomicrobium sp.]|uniref:hypothetical protein n=1 Tax=Hyphomicrobium sp. TaxID=82 RepID=UPI002D79B031|nr:hypothetical protein [Hyphomicrobium sp.]HET6390639.1 hypothetical protein [Hyphomicrobium sp.]